jgi:hypothetical protein
VRRLAATSVVGLGAVAVLAWTTLDAPLPLHAALVAGWVLMPLVLALSLARPRLRYALALPSGLVTGALVTLLVLGLPHGALAWSGWLLLAGGVMLGGVQGLWFWFRLAPVPRPLADPFSPARWILVAIHVALVVGGLSLVAAARLS